MGEEKTDKNHLYISTIGWIILIAFVATSIWLLQQYKRSILNQYAHILARVDQTAASENNRYQFITVPGTKEQFLVEPVYKYTNYNDVWTLVNRAHSIPLGYKPASLTTITVSTYDNQPLMVRNELIEPLKSLTTAAEASGVYLMVRSAYRSSEEQAAVTKEVDQGVAALPGQSEHQTGLAVDFNNQPNNCGNYCSLNKLSAQWLAENAYKYGFILRYPEGKESITGYPPEAWHYRYVGTRLAKAIHSSGLTYDEFYNLFQAARPRT